MKKKRRLRWNWIVSIIVAVYGLFVWLYTAFVLFAGSIGMLGSDYDLEVVFGLFGFLGSIALLIIEGAVILGVIAVLTLLLWGIDAGIRKIKEKLKDKEEGKDDLDY